MYDVLIIFLKKNEYIYIYEKENQKQKEIVQFSTPDLTNIKR